MSEFWTDADRKARKDHLCFECHRTIATGETYTRSAGKYEGRFWDIKRCLHCRTFADIIHRMDRDALEETSLRDWVWEYGLSPVEMLAYPNPMQWLRWSAAFRNKWTDIHGNLREVPALAVTP